MCVVEGFTREKQDHSRISLCLYLSPRQNTYSTSRATTDHRFCRLFITPTYISFRGHDYQHSSKEKELSRTVNPHRQELFKQYPASMADINVPPLTDSIIEAFVNFLIQHDASRQTTASCFRSSSYFVSVERSQTILSP